MSALADALTRTGGGTVPPKDAPDTSENAAGQQQADKKKKKVSALRKLIVAEREVRQQDATETSLGQLQPAAVQVETPLNSLSLDAPEFLPGWMSNQPAPEKSEGASQETKKVEIAASSTKTPEFIPSWMQQLTTSEQPPSEEQSTVRQESPQDGELAVSKAIERIAAQSKAEKKPKGEAKKEKKTPANSNLEVRHYVRQVLSDELDEKVKAMLIDLAKFQERARADPLKFAKLKRFCVGMSEASRSVKRGKAKCLIVAPNLDKSEADGGLDDTVEDLMDLCFEHEVPVIFSLSRNRMGKALGKNIRISIVCVLSAEGVHQEFKLIQKLAEDLRRQWVMRRMALGTQEVIAQDASDAVNQSGDEAGTTTQGESMNDRVLRHLEEKRLAEERKRAEEKRERDAIKKAQKAVKAAERKAKQEERKEELRLEQEAEAKKEEEEDKRRAAEEAEKRKISEEREKARQELVEKARAEKERKAEEERKRIEERDAAAAAAAGIDSDDSSDDDLPAGFNAGFF